MSPKKKFPKIMGIVNVTPDSFSDGGLYLDPKDAIDHGLRLMDEGADIIDVGGESTRPGAAAVEMAEELYRVIPVIDGIRRAAPSVTLSIDSSKYSVVKIALQSGASIINDITGLKSNPQIALLASEFDATLIIMHIQGTPHTMQLEPKYNNVTNEVFFELSERIVFARSLGVKSIIADVGIGFGKTLDHNLQLIRDLPKFKELNVPIMIGISRKSFLGKLLEIESPDQRDIPTALLHALLLDFNLDIIRVHNVRLVSTLKKLFNSIYN